jgi:hypothetical protein
LSDGPKLAREVLAESKAAGYSKRTIDRAKALAGVRPRKEAFGGGWVWELDPPAQGRQADAQQCHSSSGGNLGKNSAESDMIGGKVATQMRLATLGAEAGNLRDMGEGLGEVGA